MATARFTIQMMSPTAPTSSYHSLEFFVVQDGVNIFVQEYSEIFTQNPLGTISTEIIGGNVVIICTPVNENTVVKVARYGLSP